MEWTVCPKQQVGLALPKVMKTTTTTILGVCMCWGVEGWSAAAGHGVGLLVCLSSSCFPTWQDRFCSPAAQMKNGGLRRQQLELCQENH